MLDFHHMSKEATLAFSTVSNSSFQNSRSRGRTTQDNNEVEGRKPYMGY